MAEDKALVIIACKCGQKMKVPASAQGKVFKCVRCGEHLQMHPEVAVSGTDAGEPAVEPVGQLLIQQGLITGEQLQEALAAQKAEGGKIFEVLIRLGHLDKDALHTFLSRQPGIAAIDLRRFNIDRNIFELIPKELALDHLVLPIDRLGRLLTVAMACPLDTATIAEVESITGLRVKAMLCRLDDIHAAVHKAYQPKEDLALHYEKLLASMPAPARAAAAAPLNLERLEFLPGLDASIEALCGLPESTSLRMWSEALAQDPGLAALLLHKANSAAYALPGKVTNVPMAAALLGARGIRQLVQGVKKVENVPQAAVQLLHQRARRLAALGEAFAAASGKMGRATGHTYGLLSELGSLVVLMQSPAKFDSVSQDLYGQALADAQKKQLGIHFAEAGEALARAWNFPDRLAHALGSQLLPLAGEEESVGAALMHCCQAFAAAPEGELAAVSEAEAEVLSMLGLRPTEAAKAATQVHSLPPAA